MTRKKPNDFSTNRLASSTEGATLIEYAIVAPIFFLLLIGIIEVGLITFSSVVIEHATASSTRFARIGDSDRAGNFPDQVRAEIKRRSRGLINAQKVFITTNLNSYAQARPDTCLVNPDNPHPNACSGAFIDENGEPGYQNARLETGSSGARVEYRVYYPYRIISPLLYLMGNDERDVVIVSTALVKNEPF